jgi:hypothetical protein
MTDQFRENPTATTVRCLSCDKEIRNPSQDNTMGDEFLCDRCREVMLDSLEEAWKKHSAFLDSALN